MRLDRFAASGFAFEGNGSIGQASVTDSYTSGNGPNGISANADAAIDLTRIASLANGGTSVAIYGGARVTLTDSRVSGNARQLDGVSGTNGAAPHAIDLAGFDTARLRPELCECAGVPRGLCASGSTLAEYLGSFE